MIPILENHDQSKAIGKFEPLDNGRALVSFSDDARITQEMFFSIFGAGAKLIDVFEEHEIFYIRKAEILCFSLSV